MTSIPRFFRALADRTRLRILNLLADGPLCVCNIQSVLAQPQSSVSRHLALLRLSGLVRDHRDGMRTFYELTDWQQGVPAGVLKTLRRNLRAEADYRRDLDALATLKASGEFHQEGFEPPLQSGARPGRSRLRPPGRAGQTRLGTDRDIRTRSAAGNQR